MIELYTGDGKGKTSAAMGLALRAAGRGWKVLIVQFLKGSETGELVSLRHIPLISVLRNSKDYGFFPKASRENQEAMLKENNENLILALKSDARLLILDEACAAYNLGALDRVLLEKLIKENPPERELVLTGRDAPALFCAAADYISEIKKVKHPFERGVRAREGVEF